MNQIKKYRHNEDLVEVQTEETPRYTIFTSGYRDPLYAGDDFTTAARSLEMTDQKLNDLLMSDAEDD